REAGELPPVPGSAKHLLDLGRRDDHYIEVLSLQSTGPGNPHHRVRLNLAFDVEPGEQPVHRTMDRRDRRRRPGNPPIEERPTVVRRDVPHVRVRTSPLDLIDELP